MFSAQALPAAAFQMAHAIGHCLGINEAAAVDRVGRLAVQFAETHEVDIETACARLAALGARELIALVAEGPHEQTLALMEPEQVHPAGDGSRGMGGQAEEDPSSPDPLSSSAG